MITVYKSGTILVHEVRKMSQGIKLVCGKQ